MRLVLFSSFCISSLLFAEFPHRIKILNEKKESDIVKALRVVYQDYASSLLKLQIELLASDRHQDSMLVQTEFQKVNLNLRLINQS